jgi:hypothetical protein
MSRLQSSGDMAGMVALNSRANLMVATVVYPLLAFAFVFAEEIIALVYTQAYGAAAPVMRVYIAGLLVFAVELSSIILLMREGAFALRLNLMLLIGSIALSWFGAQQFGLAGAAAGSTLALYADRYVTLRRIARTTAIPVAALQDWRGLGMQLMNSAIAGALAWLIAGNHFNHHGLALHLMAGATVIAAVHGLLWLLSRFALGHLHGLRKQNIQP